MRKGMQLISILLIIAILAIPAGAASFTPSVEQKGAPTLSELTDESGKSVAAIVTDAEGREVMSVSSDSVTVTSVADIQEAPEEVQAAMEEAYKSISESKSLEVAAPALVDALEESESVLNVSDLVVRDLIHVAVDEDVAKAMEEGASITLKFDMGMEPDELLIVMVYVDGEWVVIDADKVEIHENGEVTVTFDGKLGPVACVVEKTE